MEPRHALVMMMVAAATAGCSNPTAPSPALTIEDSIALAGSETQRRAVPTPTQPIKIVQGSIVVDFAPSGSVSLQGTRGFRFEAPLREGRYPGAPCQGTHDCTPGSVISLHGLWVHPDLRGPLTLQGRTVTDHDDPDSLSGMALEVFATATAPPQAEEATLTAPFTLEGIFSSEIGSGQLEGRGLVTVFLQWEEEAWQVSGARYDFRGQAPR